MTFTPYNYCSKTHRKTIQPQEVMAAVVELTNSLWAGMKIGDGGLR
jgi:hypothetical protein